MAEASLAGWVDARGAGPAAAPGSAAAPRRAGLPLPVLAYLLAVVTPVLFYAGPLLMSSLRLVVLVMIVPLTWRLLRGRYDRLYPTDLLFLAHVVWVAVALFVNNPDRAVENAGIYFVEFFGGYVLARAYIRGPDQFSALIRVVVVLVLATLPLAVHETLTGRPLVIDLIHRLPGLTSVSVLDIEQRMGLERVQAVFAHPIHYGLFCSCAFALCYVGLQGEWGDARRVVSAGLVGLACFLGLSSGAFLALLMQLFLIGWAMALGGVRARWILLVALAVAAYIAIDLLSTRTPVRVFFSYATFSAHNAYWRGIIFEWGMMNVNDNPIFGIGLNDWIRPHFMRSGSMDNFWLVQAVRYGYPGFLAMAAGYLLVLWRIGRRDFDANPRLWRYRRGWMFTFVGLTFTLCTVHVWTSVFSFVFFLFGAGMWMLVAQPGTGGEPAPAASAPPSRYARFSHGVPPPSSTTRPRPAPPASPARAPGAPGYARGRLEEGGRSPATPTLRRRADDGGLGRGGR